MSKKHNLFATALTNAAPSANYRGENAENRLVLQKVSRDGKDYAVISPESMRNALREALTLKGLPMNRKRLHDEDQLAVEFKDFPDASKYADDYLFGFMVADPKEMKKRKLPSKRDSLLRMNLAVALAPYRYDATFHQSPKHGGQSPWKNAENSQLLHKEVSYTSFQYPFALAMRDCLSDEKQGKGWTQQLIEAIGELSGVAGGHARSLFEMAPRSIVVRVTESLVAGYDSYGFDSSGDFKEIDRLDNQDLPASEFWIGGAIVRGMTTEQREKLQANGAHLDDNAQSVLKAAANHALGG